MNVNSVTDQTRAGRQCVRDWWDKRLALGGDGDIGTLGLDVERWLEMGVRASGGRDR